MLSSAVTTIYHNCLTETQTGEQVFLCTLKSCDHDHMTIMWHNNWTTYIYILIWIVPIKCIKPIYIYTNMLQNEEITAIEVCQYVYIQQNLLNKTNTTTPWCKIFNLL